MEIKDSMTSDEFNQLMKQGVFRTNKKGKLVQQELLPEYEIMIKKPKENKFNAKKKEFKGEVYDSTKEANFAISLEADPNVLKIEKQVRFDIIINEKLIFYYKLDFKVTYKDNSIRFFDVKGYKGGCAYQVFRIKKKAVQAYYNIIIEEI